MAVTWNGGTGGAEGATPAARTVDDLLAAYADAVQARAALQGEIAAYRAANPKGPGVEQKYLTDGDGIPNTMDYRRVTLDAAVVMALHALNEAGVSAPFEKSETAAPAEVAPKKAGRGK